MLGRRETGPRSIVHALSSDNADPAVDTESSDIKQYWESMFDDQWIALRDGQQATHFQIQQLSVPQKEHADTLSSTRAKANFIIRCGLLGFDEYSVYRDDGSTHPVPQPDRKQSGKLGWLATEKWLAEFNPPSEVLFGLMAAIIHLSEAQRPL